MVRNVGQAGLKDFIQELCVLARTPEARLLSAPATQEVLRKTVEFTNAGVVSAEHVAKISWTCAKLGARGRAA